MGQMNAADPILRPPDDQDLFQNAAIAPGAFFERFKVHGRQDFDRDDYSVCGQRRTVIFVHQSVCNQAAGIVGALERDAHHPFTDGPVDNGPDAGAGVDSANLFRIHMNKLSINVTRHFNCRRCAKEKLPNVQ